MNPTLKRYLLSSLTTFTAVFLTTLAAVATTGTIMWTGSFWLAITLTATRAAVKAVIEGLAKQNAGV